MLKPLGFEEYLKAAREKSGLSQRQVSLELGYTTAQFVSNWERGLIRPPLQTLSLLCGIYKMKPKDVEHYLVNDTREKWAKCQ